MFYKVIFAITLIISLISDASLNASSSVQPEDEGLSDQPEQGKFGIIQRTSAELAKISPQLAKISAQFEAAQRSKLKAKRRSKSKEHVKRPPCMYDVTNLELDLKPREITKNEGFLKLDRKPRENIKKEDFLKR